jgi:cytochrome c
MKRSNSLPLATLSLVALLGSVPALASQELAQKALCTGCHTVATKMVGPAYKDVAAKYKGQPGAAAALIDKVRKGSTGAWGAVPMPPSGTDKINDADLKTVIDWVLKS